MIDKYLNNNERIIYQTNGVIKIDDDDGFVGYLTNLRLIFLRRTGLIFKKDRFIDLFLKHINGVNIMDQGLIFKKKYLTIRGPNADINVFGKHKDLHEFHKKINDQLLTV